MLSSLQAGGVSPTLPGPPPPPRWRSLFSLRLRRATAATAAKADSPPRPLSLPPPPTPFERRSDKRAVRGTSFEHGSQLVLNALECIEWKTSSSVHGLQERGGDW